jgi:protein-L-isoaspartate(D-aspartate) O-methyltransferase
MTDLLSPQTNERVLEVGTGLGYQTAVLAELADRVWSIEIVEEFASAARSLLRHLGYARIQIREGDGCRGWSEHSPFDKILVTAAADTAPAALLDQLKPGGRLVMPLGPEEIQRLTVVEKDATGQTRVQELLPVRFSRLETIT